MPAQQNRPAQAQPGPEGPILALLGLAAAVLSVLWLGAEAAALLRHQRTFPISIKAVVRSVGQLPKTMREPKLAWPAEVTALLPGPIAYWFCTFIVFTAAIALVATLVRLFAHRPDALDKRQRLGVATNATFASKRDLRPLLTKRSDEPDRLLLGRYNRRYLLTEPTRTPTSKARRDWRNGQGAVALIGPSRSGKSTLCIEQILAWQGPMIVTTIKGDLMDATLEHRSRVGDVKSFDPSGHTRLGSATWSPLRSCTSISGTMRAASHLVKSAPSMSTVEGADHWSKQAEMLLAGLMAVAANTPDRTMVDVANWITAQDMPAGDDTGEVAPLIRAIAASPDPNLQRMAKFATTTLVGLWKKEARSLSPVYATAANIVWPWTDPGVGASAASCDIDLDCLLAGRNTLYINAPLTEQDRMNAVLGGVLSDLIGQLTDRNVGPARPHPRLLVLIDEAGNLRLDDLPEWASVLAGMGAQLETVWQSIAQIHAAYQRKADIILTNHLTKIWFPGMSDLDGLRYASTLGGDEHVPGALSRWNNLHDDDHIRPTQLPLVETKALREMPPGKALLQHGSLPSAQIDTFQPRPLRSRRRWRRSGRR